MIRSRAHRIALAAVVLGAPLAAVAPAAAAPFVFSTGNPDGKIATATRPDSTGKPEIESADDFVLGTTTRIDHITFTGLLVGGTASDVAGAVLEIYRVFPKDSDVGRTSGAPTFSTPKVPTRVNAPSDVAFASRESGDFASATISLLSPAFTVASSVTPGGIHPKPDQNTGGNGPQTGQEVELDFVLSNPLVLPADHYFFVPQVELAGTGNFLWLSAPRPIVPPGTPFPPGSTDLQSWTRDADLDPDWLRVGTDIVGGAVPPTFNASFSLSGETVAAPAPAALVVLLVGIGAVGGLALRAKRW